MALASMLWRFGQSLSGRPTWLRGRGRLSVAVEARHEITAKCHCQNDSVLLTGVSGIGGANHDLYPCSESWRSSSSKSYRLPLNDERLGMLCGNHINIVRCLGVRRFKGLITRHSLNPRRIICDYDTFLCLLLC